MDVEYDMSNTEFLDWARGLVEDSFEIMEKANQEYASDEAKFDNFHGIAEFFRRFNPRLKDITAEDVASIYFLKHFVSILKGVSLREPMEGRISDAANYILLIGGMMEEARRREIALS